MSVTAEWIAIGLSMFGGAASLGGMGVKFLGDVRVLKEELEAEREKNKEQGKQIEGIQAEVREHDKTLIRAEAEKDKVLQGMDAGFKLVKQHMGQLEAAMSKLDGKIDQVARDLKDHMRREEDLRRTDNTEMKKLREGLTAILRREDFKN